MQEGLVLEPMHTMHTKLLGNIIRHMHSLMYIIYADDTQVYLDFDSTNTDGQINALARLVLVTVGCLNDIRHWMHNSYLKLNNEITELIFL
jgi:hypothetical protein